MAIVQDFEANFTQFQSAVAAADAQLKSFSTDSDKIAAQLGRMTDQFSGTKVIQQATLMAEAIDRVGGASSLTTAELAKIAPTINDAVAKMSKMGVDVPANLQAIADKTKDVHTETASLSDTVLDLATKYIAFETLKKAFDWVNDVAASAQALENLSNQTHINVEDLQILQAAFADAGVDATELAKALFTVSQKAATGDDSVARGLHMMGMSLEDIKGLEGEQLFLAIEHGLSTLQGSLRDTAAAEIFGSKLGRAMAGASTNIDETIQKLKDANVVIGTDSVHALAEYNKALEETKRNLSNMAATAIGPVAEGFNTLYNTAQKVGWWPTLKAALADMALSNTATGASTSHLAALIDQTNQSTQRATAATQAATAASKDHVVQLTAEQQAAQFVASVQKDATKALTDWQAADLEALDKMGQANEKNAAAIGISAEQFAAWKTAAEAAKEEGKQFAAAVEEVNTAGQGWQGTIAQMDGGTVDWGKHLLEAGVSANAVATYLGLTATQVAALNKSIADDNAQLKLQQDQVKTAMGLWNDYFTLRSQHGATATDQQIADIHRWEQAQILAAQHAKTDTVAFYAALAAEVNEKLRSISVDWSSLNNTMTTDTKAGLQQIADKAKATLDYALTQVGTFSAAAIQKYRDAADAAQAAADNWGTAYATNADKATAAIEKTGQAIDDVATKTKQAADAAKAQQAMTYTMGPSNNRAALDALAAQTGGEVVNDSYGNPYVWIPGVNAPPPSHRATGGPVTAGAPYYVGERGPELFVPSSSGSIVPNGAGGPVIQNTFHLVDTASNLARQVSDLIARQVTQARRV